MFYRILLLIPAVLFSACAHQASNRNYINDRLTADDFTHVKMNDPVLLRLKAIPGQVEKTKFNSASKTEVFEAHSLTNTIEESIEFRSKTEILNVLPGEQFVEKITTSNKDGQIDLHDFAMPEIGEELVVTYTSTGKILKVGQLPPDSLYYVPPISLPFEKVIVGDTWTMTAHWVTEQGVPLNLKLLSILKGFVSCGAKDVCADIELSGEVTIDTSLAGVSFQSLWVGRIFFALNRGSLVWSLVESHEAWDTEKIHREVGSCLESNLVEPAGIKLWKEDQHKCQVRGLSSL